MRYDLSALNSATKYPSIPTYHALGAKGRLAENAVHFDGDVIGTEKIDGTNARIIVTPDGDWFIGSREEILTACSDRVPNPAQGIVAAIASYAETCRRLASPGDVVTLYGEVYGHKGLPAWKQYGDGSHAGFRLFDVSLIDPTLLDQPREQIAAWRDSGGQAFAVEDELLDFAEAICLPLTPRLFTVDGSELPKDVAGMAALIQQHSTVTRASLDESGIGQSEGIVLRSRDRRTIAKARHADYRRTLGGRP